MRSDADAGRRGDQVLHEVPGVVQGVAIAALAELPCRSAEDARHEQRGRDALEEVEVGAPLAELGKRLDAAAEPAEGERPWAVVEEGGLQSLDGKRRDVQLE